MEQLFFNENYNYFDLRFIEYNIWRKYFHLKQWKLVFYV